MSGFIHWRLAFSSFYHALSVSGCSGSSSTTPPASSSAGSVGPRRRRDHHECSSDVLYAPHPRPAEGPDGPFPLRESMVFGRFRPRSGGIHYMISIEVDFVVSKFFALFWGTSRRPPGGPRRPLASRRRALEGLPGAFRSPGPGPNNSKTIPFAGSFLAAQ